MPHDKPLKDKPLWEAAFITPGKARQRLCVLFHPSGYGQQHDNCELHSSESPPEASTVMRLKSGICFTLCIRAGTAGEGAFTATHMNGEGFCPTCGCPTGICPVQPRIAAHQVLILEAQLQWCRQLDLEPTSAGLCIRKPAFHREYPPLPCADPEYIRALLALNQNGSCVLTAWAPGSFTGLALVCRRSLPKCPAKSALLECRP